MSEFARIRVFDFGRGASDVVLVSFADRRLSSLANSGLKLFVARMDEG